VQERQVQPPIRDAADPAKRVLSSCPADSCNCSFGSSQGNRENRQIPPEKYQARVSAFEMNLRHTVALASVGWYLMAPPVSSTGEPNVEAPLSVWHAKGGPYATEQACDQEYKVKAALTFGRVVGPHVSSQTRSEECIADDDPRLAR
jgi:hypothetical protein